jgi:hypothetical protein
MSEKDFIKSELDLLKLVMVGLLGALFILGNSLVQNYPSKYDIYSFLLGGFAVIFIFLTAIYIKTACGLKKLE